MRFTPLIDFESKELRSHYVKGMTYTVRPRQANPEDENDHGTPLEKTLLYEQLQEWVKDGRARIITEDDVTALRQADPAQVRGRGKVT